MQWTLRARQRIGKYQILRRLAQGGFADVYQAQDTLLGEEVAVKELIPALVGDESTLKRFLAEARATLQREEAVSQRLAPWSASCSRTGLKAA